MSYQFRNIGVNDYEDKRKRVLDEFPGYKVVNVNDLASASTGVNYNVNPYEDGKKQQPTREGGIDLNKLNDLYGGLQGSESLLGLGDSSRAYQLAANRGEKRITATQKRVQELVKLDPTHPLAALVTMLGAREEYLTRKDLDELRGKERKGELSKKRIAAFEKTLSLGNNEKVFGAVVQRHFEGDVMAAMNHPDITKMMVAERKRPVPLDIFEQGKLIKAVAEAEDIFKSMQSGTKFGTSAQKAMYKRYIAMANQIIHNNQHISLDDQENFTKMGTMLSRGQDPNGGYVRGFGPKGPIASSSFTGQGERYFGKEENVTDLTKFMAEKHSDKLPAFKDAMKHYRNGTATEEDMQILDSAKKLRLDSSLMQLKTPPTLMSKAGKKLGEVSESINEYVKRDDKVSGVQSFLANIVARGLDRDFGDNFLYESKDTESRTHRNMFNGVEHDAFINMKNGTYITEHGGKLIVGRIEGGIKRIEDKDGNGVMVRTLGKQLKTFDMGSGWRQAVKTPKAWTDAISYSNKLGEHKIITIEEANDINNSSSSPTPITPMSEADLREPTGYDASKDPDRIGVRASEKHQVYSTDTYDAEVTQKELMLKNLDVLIAENQGNLKEVSKLNALKEELVNDKSSDDGDSVVVSVLKDIEQSQIAQGLEDNPIVSQALKVGGVATDLVNQLSVEDVQTLGQGHDEFKNKYGIDADKLPFIGTAGKVWREVQTIVNAEGLSGKAQAIEDLGARTWSHFFGDAETEKLLPNTVPLDGLVNPPENYSEYMTDLVGVETGWRNKIGYKLEVKRNANGEAVLRDGEKILVYSRDASGKKIPQSYGVAQLTIDTAFKTPFGEELLKSADIGRTKEERMKNKIKLLMIPSYNLKMGKQFADILRKKFRDNAYSKDWKQIDMDLLVATAYNFKGEGMIKLLNQKKPKSFNHFVKIYRFPVQTGRHINNMVRKILGRGRPYGN